MWRKFAMELVTDYEPNKEALELILNHIKILCNHEEIVYDYFIKWIAQMIQYPETKSVCMVLISKEGAGKGTLLRLLEKMFGNDKIFQTTNPSRDVFGEFNNHMANSFFVNLDELSKKETMESEGKIKGLITEPRITINNKGVNKYEINSYHRFMITTNNEEPVNTTKDDRRKAIIRSSDELIGDKEYFNKLYDFLDDVNVVKTCFEYFKSIEGMDDFNKIPLPSTQYHNELKEISKSPIEKWIEDFTLENMEKETVELTKEEILASFNEWCSNNKVEYKVDSLKLMVRINRLNINGIVKHKTKTANKTQFVISDLKTHFGLGCLI
jgi:putative DNA primase/helicase